MKLYNLLRTFGNLPITHQVLVAALTDYKRPNEKIHDLINKQILIPLKKGIYLLDKEMAGTQPDNILIANYLSGPSYVSMEYALRYYGAIPEKVFIVTSVSLKPTKKIENLAGIFTYTHLPLPYYSYGIIQENLNGEFGLMATQEKALCDKIVTTSGIQFRSSSQVHEFLLEDLRIEEDWIKSLNISLIERWLEKAPKKNSLLQLIKAIKEL